jgi:hypothetical protein
MDIDKILEASRAFYFESGDFNGYPVYRLKKEFALTESSEVKQTLVALIESERATVEFGNYHPNPHIKAFPSLQKEKQLELLGSIELSDHFCIYPSIQSLEGAIEAETYNDEPFKKMLARGAGQLEFRVFDLAVLEHYRNDPRYYYSTDSIQGYISVHNEFFESEDMEERDQVLLQTFGFAYDDDLNRGVAVFLRYLADLSSEHQRVWAARELPTGYKLHPDYYRTNVIGDWPERMSIFDAFVQELKLINDMSALMSRPPLFRESFSEKPKGFEFLLRPTAKELQDFCLLLDKMMSDNIDKAFFGSDIPLETDSVRDDGKVVVTQRGTIALLEDWIRKYFRPSDPEPLNAVFAVFKRVRKLRQKPAHVVNDDTFDQQNFKEQRELMMQAYNAIRSIRLIFANHPAVRAQPPDIYPELRDGKIWTR